MIGHCDKNPLQSVAASQKDLKCHFQKENNDCNDHNVTGTFINEDGLIKLLFAATISD
jgi:hypothetical protein